MYEPRSSAASFFFVLNVKKQRLNPLLWQLCFFLFPAIWFWFCFIVRWILTRVNPCHNPNLTPKSDELFLSDTLLWPLSYRFWSNSDQNISDPCHSAFRSLGHAWALQIDENGRNTYTPFQAFQILIIPLQNQSAWCSVHSDGRIFLPRDNASARELDSPATWTRVAYT